MSLPENLSIADAFRRAAAKFADNELIWQPEGGVRFCDVDQASDRVAGALLRSGIQPGDRVALYCINGVEFVQAYLGIQKAGAVVVPVNLLITPDEIAYILNDAGVSSLIYHQAMETNVAAFRDRISGLQSACCIGESDGDDLRFDDWLSVEADLPLLDVDPAEDLAAILYTSGTTGHPKGAMLTHRNLLSNTASVVQGLQLQPGEDRLLVVLPMFHAFAATVGMLTPALHGLTIVPVPKFDPALVSRTIEASKATVFLGVPSMYAVLLRIDDAQLAAWQTVRYGVAGGAAMPVEVMRQFEQRFAFPILEGDGPTECSPVTCVNPLQGARKPGSVGLPVPDVQMTIMDTKGAALADDEIGEICVLGPNVMKGYWNLPEATAETFHGEWLRTGDLGYRDNDGYFFMVDRIKDMIIVNGMNVYPRMIEEVLYQHPKVAEAAVVGEPDQLHGEIVIAHIVAEEGESLDASEVRRFCNQHLGQHQRPKKIILRDALPKNATGKILKRELRKQGELERGIDSRD